MPVSILLLVVVAVVVRFFAPGGEGVVPGPLSGLGTPGLIIGLIIANVVVAAIAMFGVTRAARLSRDKGLRAVTAVEGVPAK